MNNQNGTSSVIRPTPGKESEHDAMQASFARTGINPWQPIAGGNISQAMAAAHAQPDNALAQVKDQLVGPKPLVVARDDTRIEA